MLLTIVILFYLFLARYTRNLFKIQFHSLVHCFNAVACISYLFYKSNIDLLTWNIKEQLKGGNSDLIYFCITNSNGYFIADTLDIISDNKNLKRKNYIIHHLVAIVGLMTVYLKENDNIFFGTWVIWCLEIGGIVHHLKYMSELYSFQHHTLISLIYVCVYASSRIYFIGNVLNILYLNFTVLYGFIALGCTILFVQNAIWLFKNIIKDFNLSDKIDINLLLKTVK